MVSGVAAVYNRYAYLNERREALIAWDNHLNSVIAGKNDKSV
jgi:hypothetical protein